MSPLLRPCLALALLLAASVPRAARADEAEAARHFKEGAAAYAKRDFQAAARAFEAAHVAEPSAAALYNAGLSWEETSALAKAADDYDHALSFGGLSATQAKDAKRRLALLAPRLGTLRVDAPPGAHVAIDGGDPGNALAPRYVAPGDHGVEVTFEDGRKASKSVSVAPGATATATFDQPPPEPPHPPPPPPPQPFFASPVRTAGVVVAGAGVLTGGIAVGLGAAALGALHTFNASSYTDASAHDSAASLRTGANVSLVLAGLLGAAGVVMIVLPPRGPAPATSLRVGPGAVSVDVRF